MLSPLPVAHGITVPGMDSTLAQLSPRTGASSSLNATPKARSYLTRWNFGMSTVPSQRPPRRTRSSTAYKSWLLLSPALISLLPSPNLRLLQISKSSSLRGTNLAYPAHHIVPAQSHNNQGLWSKNLQGWRCLCGGRWHQLLSPRQPRPN